MGGGGASSFQTPNALREEHITKRTLSAAIVGVMLTALGAVAAQAQDLKAMLLKPANGWVLEWSNPDTGNSGVSEAVFADRGDKFVAKMNITVTGANPHGLMNCERDVTLTADTVGFDGCRDSKIALTLDPSDAAYPLKAKSRSADGYLYKAKAK
jgi:hypothetical protein